MMNKKIVTVWLILLLNLFACRPVIAIGWEELLVMFVLVAFLLGPPLYRFMQRIENFRQRPKKNK